MVAYSSYNNRNAINKLRNDYLLQVSQNVSDRISSYITPVTTSVEMGKELLEVQLQKETDPRNFLRKYCYNLLKSYPQLHFLYFTDNDGNYYGIERRKEHFVIWDLESDPKKGKTLKYLFLDSSNNVVKEQVIDAPEYDPHTRQWYKKATEKQRSVWTDLYVFFTDSPVAGITYSDVVTINNEQVGVMAADLSLENLSRFLTKLSVGHNGVVIVVDEQDRVLAHPDLPIPMSIDQKTESLELIKAGNSSIDWLDSIYKKWKSIEQRTDDITIIEKKIDNEPYILSAFSVTGYFSDKWKIFIIVPEDDYIGALKRTNEDLLMFAILLMIVLSIIILFISKGISEPISNIAESIKLISDLNFKNETQINSPIIEVCELAESTERMKIGLMAFEKYVPVKLVKQLLNSEKTISIGGRKRNVTVFFSDIENFTQIAEQVEPEFLLKHLSDYFEEMTSPITNNGGTIDKYIGDSIMAFWGAPEDNPEQVENACLAAMECQYISQSLNKKWASENKPEFKTRIGLATGVTHVGNMGSSDRFNYTVLGDLVNVASRLENVNKVYKTSVLISESTYNQLPESKFICRPIDSVKLKGKSNEVAIYQLLGAKKVNETWVSPVFTGIEIEKVKIYADLYKRSYALYIAKQYQDAQDLLQKAKEIISDSDNPTDYDFSVKLAEKLSSKR